MSNNTSSRNFIPMANKYDRVILLVDMDCFYCQVEEKLDPSLKSQPLAVVQYNAWRGGGIIAVNYAARAKGVTRHMRGDEAKEQCPDIKLVKVPNVREKADLSKYREAGKEVARVLQRFTPLLERASVDEAYLDITEAVNKRLQKMNEGTFVLQPQELVNTYVVGYETIGEFVTSITTSFITHPLPDDDKFYSNFNENDVPAVRQSNIRLLIGASIASEIRKAVEAETSYECSAGIAHNKILAKLACGINKPNKQTILPLAQIPKHFETLPVGKIKGLGAKFGEEVCERLKIRYLGQLLKFTEAELQRQFDEKTGTWLYNIGRGIDLEAVTPRFYSKSIGCCKKFPGRNNITGLKTLQHWLNELANEINERLEKDICENNRRAKQMVVSFIQEFDGEEVSSSRSAPLQSYDTEMLVTTSLEIIKSNTKQFFRSGSQGALNNPIKFLGISVGKFETISNSQNNIQEMFAQQAAKKQKLKAHITDEMQRPGLVLNQDKIESQTEHKTNTELENSSPKLKTSEGNTQKSFFLNKLTNSTSKSEGKQGFQTANELINKIPGKMSNQDDTKQIKSFFFNALRKDKPNENTKSTGDLQCEVEENVKRSSLANERAVTAAMTKAESANENFNTYPTTSFFARTLRTTQQKEQSANEDCNELNELLNHINNIPYEEHAISSDVQHEVDNNSATSDNILESQENIVPKKRKYEKISGNEAATQQDDYRSQYVEYAIPELANEFLLYTNCSKCGAKILDEPNAIQTHQDHHFAQELSQQQRHEFRDEMRSKILSSKSSPNGSNKKVQKPNLNSSIKKPSTGIITKFLKPAAASTTLSYASTGAENDTTESSSTTSNVEICDICQLPVNVEDILEHKDFHMAKDLQRKLNQLEVRTVAIAKKSTANLSRKSVNTSPNMSSQSTKSTAKPITQFFTQPNL